MNLKWEWKEFSELSGDQMHEVLTLRQEVFIVEQKCIYPDADSLDRLSLHLTGRDDKGKLIAYLRVNLPGTRFEEPSPGRILTNASARGEGHGKAAVLKAVELCRNMFPGLGIKISAQTYLLDFYRRLGFRTSGSPYDEDGIEHVDMIKKP